MKVAIVGATGAVGREMKALLAERGFPVDELRLLASARSVGAQVDGLTVQEATPEAFDGIDLALFSASSDVARELAPAARDRGALVIDNSSAFRMDQDVPLVIPEVNAHELKELPPRRIIAVPNCATIQLVVALAPIHQDVGIRRIVMASYQSTSGAGRRAMQELSRQVTDL